MQRVLSFPSRSLSDPSELVTKRMCCSFMFSIGFICLLVGFLLGRFAFNQELEISRNKLKSAQQRSSGVINNNDFALDNLISRINTERLLQYSRELQNLNVSSDESLELQQARVLWNHLRLYSFDHVSELVRSQLLLSFPDPDKDNKVIVEDERLLPLWSCNDTRFTPKAVRGYSVKQYVKDAPVYINFGRDEDYSYLESLSISVQNKIVIARVGKLLAVDIVDNALEHEVGGVIIYQDPQQSNLKLPLLSPLELAKLQSLHGDASLTPGANEEYSGPGSVPVVIISASDAVTLFSMMSEVVPSPMSWRGDLHTNYPIGPGFINPNNRISLVVNTLNTLKMYYNVLGTLSGSEESDRLIVIADERDLWDNVPALTTAIQMELATVFGELQQEGWKPYRSLMIASWGLEGFERYIKSLDEERLNLLGKTVVSYIRLHLEPSDIHTNTIKAEGSLGFKKGLNDAFYASDQDLTQLDYIMDFNTENNIVSEGIPFLQLSLNCCQSDHTLETFPVALGRLIWSLTTTATLPLDGESYVEFLNHSINVVNKHLGGIARKHALFLDSLTNSISEYIKTWNSFHMDWISSPSLLKTRINNDRLLSMVKGFSCSKSNSEMDDDKRHMLFSRGKSSLDPSTGFGVLQDLLREITSANSTNDLHQEIVTHLTLLVQCLESVKETLVNPVNLLVGDKT